MTIAQKKRIEKYEQKPKTRCPFCSAPLIEELGVKRCANSDCTYKVEKQFKQEQII